MFVLIHQLLPPDQLSFTVVSYQAQFNLTLLPSFSVITADHKHSEYLHDNEKLDFLQET